ITDDPLEKVLAVNQNQPVRRRVPGYEAEYKRCGWKIFPSIERCRMNHSVHGFCENGSFRSFRQRHEFGYAGNVEHVVSPAAPFQLTASHTADPGGAAPSMGRALIRRRRYRLAP